MGEKFQHRMFVVKITVELQILALTMLVCALNIYIYERGLGEQLETIGEE